MYVKENQTYSKNKIQLGPIKKMAFILNVQVKLAGKRRKTKRNSMKIF